MILSLVGVANEIRPAWYPLARAIARVRLRGRQIHPVLFQRSPRKIDAPIIFASAGWRDDAVKAGLRSTRSTVVSFGVRLRKDAVVRRPGGERLLWAGRLDIGKGLHFVLEALPYILAERPNARLTAIEGHGPDSYRRYVMEIISRLNLQTVVDLIEPVGREDLATYFHSHDVLCFYSPFKDPVALVLMEGFASGLPVVANAAGPEASLVRPGETCLTYRLGDPQSLAKAVLQPLGDEPLRAKLTENAASLVRTQFSLEAMGAAFDRELRAVMRGSRSERP